MPSGPKIRPLAARAAARAPRSTCPSAVWAARSVATPQLLDGPEGEDLERARKDTGERGQMEER